MSVVYSGNAAHDRNQILSEAAHQVALKAASTQAAVRACDATHFRNCLESAIKNGISPGIYYEALAELGIGRWP
jgi:hypothetical protein